MRIKDAETLTLAASAKSRFQSSVKYLQKIKRKRKYVLCYNEDIVAMYMFSSFALSISFVEQMSSVLILLIFLEQCNKLKANSSKSL